jgi:methyltransferase
MSALFVVLSLVIAQRLIELAWANRNTRRLLARGAVEVGARHYPLFVALHAGWLLAIATTVDPETPINWFWAAGYGLVQAARFWVMFSLGKYFTTRIITLPGAALVRRGPYRYIAHPNYAVVVAEIIALPMIFGAVWIALVFSVLNAALLFHRIRVESAALGPRRSVREKGLE